MNRSLTKLEKSTAIISNSKASKWCYVNTENEFKFMGKTFVIDPSVDVYKVHNKAGTTYEYTNESYMFEILVVIDKEDKLKFYNQNYDYIESELVKVK
ncbi:hypothetical protein PQE66_gp246 [Bacillus phage PBC2]|uniref:Uncharacterized protein n=1 Tax=Bacillus phage PBC2 TaxID=1675029 RepID=A0A218KCE4_9CAUD|nr:hypothetical protein PQE66_gp246 [Bacillus phage PBC2]AKQ08550.1 hypothetical protein PBC2_235 [Bacillus phage PBC2]